MPVVAKDVSPRDRVSPLTEPPSNFAAVTKSDTDELTYVVRALYVGGAGDVSVVGKDSGTVTFKAVPAGTTLVGRFKQVRSTLTTATDIVAMW